MHLGVVSFQEMDVFVKVPGRLLPDGWFLQGPRHGVPWQSQLAAAHVTPCTASYVWSPNYLLLVPSQHWNPTCPDNFKQTWTLCLT